MINIPDKELDDIKLFRKMVDDLVHWHALIPAENHVKLVNDIMKHVPTLLKSYTAKHSVHFDENKTQRDAQVFILDWMLAEVVGADDDPGEPSGPDEYMDERDKGWYEGRNQLRATQRQIIKQKKEEL